MKHIKNLFNFFVYLLCLKTLNSKAETASHDRSQNKNTISKEILVSQEQFAKLPDGLNPASSNFQNESSVSSLMLAFWNMSRGQVPNENIAKSAGLKTEEIKNFLQTLPASAKITSSDQQALRKSYTKDSFKKRNEARAKFLRFVSKMQDRFPGTAEILPELLTVWGEARNIRGFDELDSINQQAKMATIVHVIRNRTQRRAAQRPDLKSYKNKWDVVTRRYQFSAFEPYDPNLAELAFGPNISSPAQNSESLPRNDRVALDNLAKVISGLNKGHILLSSPLVHQDTYHYLTPQLLKFNKENYALLKSEISKKNQRFSILKIPTSNPQFLSAVPRWSKQTALISYPPVKIKHHSNLEFQTQIVNPSDFIYFKGLR